MKTLCLFLGHARPQIIGVYADYGGMKIFGRRGTCPRCGRVLFTEVPLGPHPENSIKEVAP